ncbi:SAF domain-containing protein [Acidihalobacter prosperus]|uniref:Flagellar basal body P-ring biosynthesis protein FlgA n=1 Tax=Acidihalobacter prosperus TaxID=160660 RepID=A0A1A6C8G6_9GAMM|nr:SAF domain-containing protein [Acidihalobacter prosperus]OBS10839.1 flagellar basal body P-ring biosynthesis protein FlgA [Acidihalobacter prosperus]
MATHFLVHNKADRVGVVVVEGVKAGQPLTGWLLENDTTLNIEAKDDIPLGHKIALVDVNEHDTIIEYEHDIGRAVARIGKGHHVHVHNIKTKRW